MNSFGLMEGVKNLSHGKQQTAGTGTGNDSACNM